MSQAQVQTRRQNTTTKIFRLKYPYYVTTSSNKIGVVLRRRDGKSMAAFLDPARIKKVMVVAVPSKKHSGMREAVVVSKGKIFIEFFDEDKDLEKLRKQYPDATIYPDAEVERYIVYETNHDYYKPAELDSIDGAVIKEGTVQELLKEEKMIQPCGGNKWRVYLYEDGTWDDYCFDLATAFEILMTNIHPVYGVMD